MHRHLETDWMLLEARTTVRHKGVGSADAVMFDEHGPFGVATQPVMMEPLANRTP
jgi:acyl-CoA thioesterase